MVLVVEGMNAKWDSSLLRLPGGGNHWTRDFNNQNGLAGSWTVVGGILKQRSGSQECSQCVRADKQGWVVVWSVRLREKWRQG